MGVHWREVQEGLDESQKRVEAAIEDLGRSCRVAAIEVSKYVNARNELSLGEWSGEREFELLRNTLDELEKDIRCIQGEE